MTPLPSHKTKIVCTIGPASSSLEVIKKMIQAGMNVARLNFSHGDFKSHKKIIQSLRSASKSDGKEVAIMADLPGPKIRLGELEEDPIELKAGEDFTLTTQFIKGNHKKASLTFKNLPAVVHVGDSLFLNDGIIQLKVKHVKVEEVQCQVVVGGELRSRKGLNLPGINLGMSAFTKRDHEILKFALQNGVDAISQSFVTSPLDMKTIRKAAQKLGYEPFLVAKIERLGAVHQIDEILEVSDGIMVARGDLGVETPFEQMAILQKKLIQKALLKGKPVITATQMLESMLTNRRPTRAEATDVANAILDGTDCVMLSGESAMGKNPVLAVRTLAKIAAATEPHSTQHESWHLTKFKNPKQNLPLRDLLSLSVETVLDSSDPAAVIVPTRSGSTARGITRFRLPVWVVAPTPDKNVSRHLNFSYGVLPEWISPPPSDWSTHARTWIKTHKLTQKLGILVQGPSTSNPNRNHMMELIELT